MVITIIPLILIILFSDMLFSQEKGKDKSMPTTMAVTHTTDIHFYFLGGGWHVVHKRAPERFLREALPRRTDICFKCHEKDEYRIFDPHNQLNENGDIIAEKCLYCHIEKPDEINATYQDVKFIANPGLLCQRCHGEQRNHPANAPHLLIPSVKILTLMKEGEQLFGIIFSLDKDGKIICSTCHNPHEKGVIPAGRFEAKGAGREFKHRVPDKMCIVCHEK